MKKSFFLCLFLCTGCSSNSFLDYYNDEQIPLENIIPCDIKDIRLIETTEPEEKIKKYEKQGFVVLGFSEFESNYYPYFFASEAARKKKACIVILETSFERNETRTYLQAIPQYTDSYYSGAVDNVTYSGHINSISTSYVERTYSVAIFNQKAFFLGKYKENKK